MSFDRLPDDVLYGAWQILKVFNKELCWIFSITWQRLHHAQHLAHIGFRLMEDALYSFTVKLTARFIELQEWADQ